MKLKDFYVYKYATVVLLIEVILLLLVGGLYIFVGQTEGLFIPFTVIMVIYSLIMLFEIGHNIFILIKLLSALKHHYEIIDDVKFVKIIKEYYVYESIVFSVNGKKVKTSPMIFNKGYSNLFNKGYTSLSLLKNYKGEYFVILK